MSTISAPTIPRSRSGHSLTPTPLLARDAAAALPHINPHHRGGEVMFQVRFRSAMGDADLAVLAHVLDLTTHMRPKMRPDPNSPGVVRLDHFSGLFLERGADERQWILEGRTWGRPAPEVVHEWHLLAAHAARHLDPAATVPDTRSSTPDRSLGRVSNKRLTHLRRLVGRP